MPGITQIVISLGAAGALLVDSGRGWLATPPAIKQHNPIGAGDSLVAGLVWGLSNALAPDDMLRWGVACGAAVASHVGTAFGSYDEVARLAEQVTVRAI